MYQINLNKKVNNKSKLMFGVVLLIMWSKFFKMRVTTLIVSYMILVSIKDSKYL